MCPTGHIRRNMGAALQPWNRSRHRQAARGDGHCEGNRRTAEKELRRLLRTLDTGEHVDPTRMTVREWLKAWLSAVREEVSPKSQRTSWRRSLER